MTRERWRGGGVLEIACDESGSDGENLTGGNTEVFAHASVDLSPKDAAACVRETRDRIRSPAQEYKANHLLREKHRAVLEWLLSPAGPVHGHAHVHVVDKAFFVVDRTVDLLLGERSGAVALFRDGPRVFGAERWREFLTAANGLLRVRVNGVPTDAGDMFFRTVEGLRRAHPGTEPDGADGAAVAVLERLAGARERADAWRARTLAAPVPIPVLNPLLPAIVATAAHWSEGGRPVSLVHDRQNLLTPDRIAWIEAEARREGVVLAGFRLVHSRLDARVQVADFLAGIARRITDDEIAGRGDPALTALLRPYLGRAPAGSSVRGGADRGTEAAVRGGAAGGR